MFNNDPTGSWVQSFLPSTERETMLGELADHFYMNEQGVLVHNGLSTYLICFPSDLHPLRKGRLPEKISHAKNYAASFLDEQELNALKHIAATEDHYPDDFLALGLYLYFADECSRLNKPVSFLTALRKANVTLRYGKTFNSEDLLAHAHAALANLGMEASHGAVLDEWKENGRFTIRTPEGNELNDASSGAYVQLAHQISQGEKPDLNRAISYALGNRASLHHSVHVQEISPAQALTQLKTQLLFPAKIESSIEAGRKKREAVITRAIRETMKSSKPVSAEAIETARARAKNIFAPLPDAALKILRHEGYMFAYADTSSLAELYPNADLPGVPEFENNNARKSKALHQTRHHTIFLSNGKNGQAASDDTKNQIMRQSILHETMHMVINGLSDEEKKQLEEAVGAIHDELAQYDGRLLDYYKAQLTTLKPRSLAEVLDNESKLYDYADYKEPKDIRWMEVACNALGLMYTDYPYPHPPQNGANDPYNASPAFTKLADMIVGMLEKRAAAIDSEKREVAAPVISFPTP